MSNLYEFMLFLYTRTFDEIIHWHILNTSSSNVTTIESCFYNERNKKSYKVILTTENNIMTIKIGSTSQSTKERFFKIKEKDLIETKNNIIDFVVQNNETETEEVLFRNIVQSEYL